MVRKGKEEADEKCRVQRKRQFPSSQRQARISRSELSLGDRRISGSRKKASPAQEVLKLVPISPKEPFPLLLAKRDMWLSIDIYLRLLIEVHAGLRLPQYHKNLF